MGFRVPDGLIIEAYLACDKNEEMAIDYILNRMSEKRADSCQLLGEYMEALEQNFKAAYTLFKQNCEERKYPKSCFKYGMYLLSGKECTPDLTKMIEPMEIACDGNLKQGCRQVLSKSRLPLLLILILVSCFVVCDCIPRNCLPIIRGEMVMKR
ncbi:unnamed protein product [Nippostrongylus brasiliensis]|uniref:UV excision repair protein RAD23 n=1 Tax=Nippostrongylus brasiliensis TaxID=27835 RepID=A0A0N4YU42_NIPBR|nr:unnamed protein product [Nippostrongylus brasiliensis]